MKQSIKLMFLFAATFMLVCCYEGDSNLFVKAYESDIPEESLESNLPVKLTYPLLCKWMAKHPTLVSVMDRIESRYKSKIAQLEYVSTHSEETFEKAEAELDKILIEKDLKNPDVAFKDLSIPDASSIYGSEGNRIGVIDLGLPSGTKWGICNLGNSIPSDDLRGFETFLTEEKPERPTLLILEKPEYGVLEYILARGGESIGVTKDDEIIVTIPYNEYMKRLGGTDDLEDLYMQYFQNNDAMEALAASVCEDLYGDYITHLESNKNLIDTYKNDLQNYVRAYKDVKDDYYIYLFDNKYKYIFDLPGNRYAWGLGQADFNSDEFPADLDPATAVSEHLCTPTLEQVQELSNCCTWSDVLVFEAPYNNYVGYYRYLILTGPNGKKIGFGKFIHMINAHDKGSPYYYGFLDASDNHFVIETDFFNNHKFCVRPVYK